jgi:hypothetical protein
VGKDAEDSANALRDKPIETVDLLGESDSILLFGVREPKGTLIEARELDAIAHTAGEHGGRYMPSRSRATLVPVP